MGQLLSNAILDAERTLAAAGVPRARADAEALAAFALGLPRLTAGADLDLPGEVLERLTELVTRRARREPLGHITGTATLAGIELEVGPGVFVPRVQTELLLAWGLEVVRQIGSPVIVDLCTGSAAVALAAAHARPDAIVHAIEVSTEALAFAEVNARRRAAAGDTLIHLHHADVADPGLLRQLAGRVDLVLSNPPYVPESKPIPAEWAEHHPRISVYAGADGLDVIRHVIACAARLLRLGGGVAIEHDDPHGELVAGILRSRSCFQHIEHHRDQDGRPRYTTARRSSESLRW
jgi:release factor glutamine methyltransferase